jgi:enhancing lycopene biosynthesis protein 2
VSKKRVAVILSGCGVYDGAEIYESVLTLLRLDQQGAEVSCFAPNISQMHVINHLTADESISEPRNVLVEAARIVRGEIADLALANHQAFDAVIVPGGFGAAKNLSNFALAGSGMMVNPTFKQFIQSMHSAGKPVGLICIAPAMAGKLFAEGVKCTVGNDPQTATAVEQTGARHEICAVDEICIDPANKLVTTPAYMLAESISQAAIGINKLVDTVLEMA